MNILLSRFPHRRYDFRNKTLTRHNARGLDETPNYMYMNIQITTSQLHDEDHLRWSHKTPKKLTFYVPPLFWDLSLRFMVYRDVNGNINEICVIFHPWCMMAPSSTTTCSYLLAIHFYVRMYNPIALAVCMKQMTQVEASLRPQAPAIWQ